MKATPASRRLSPGPVEARGAAIAASLVALAVVAWLLTDTRMSDMDGGPAMDPGALGFYVTVWVVMMAAMMFPSITPMVSIYDRLRAGHRARGGGAPPDATALFVGGYLIVWTAAGLAAFALAKLIYSADVPALSWDRGGHWVAAGVVLAAALYQLTPLKDACLSKCRGPLSFLMERWRDGRIGALRIGFAHGAWCVGCCWALMATLFVVGLMSIGWMVFVAALIAFEKLWPSKAVANGAVAGLLLALAVAVALAPDSVPGMDMPMDTPTDMPMGG